jgi:predicted RNase H-like HicB family nuclease
MTSRASRKPSARKTQSRGPIALERPFESEIWAHADEVAGAYRFVLEPDRLHGWIGKVLEFPTVFERGATPEDCLRRTREALRVAVAVMLERGETPPVAMPDARNQQVNVRLTPDEKLLFEGAARQGGYRGMSDFLRAAGLGALRQKATG